VFNTPGARTEDYLGIADPASKALARLGSG